MKIHSNLCFFPLDEALIIHKLPRLTKLGDWEGPEGKGGKEG
jgi:hypothetical protein